MSNAFRKEDGSLDREYLRVCGLYRLTRMKRLPRAAAKELANKPFGMHSKRLGWLDGTIDIWFNGPFKAHND